MHKPCDCSCRPSCPSQPEDPCTICPKASMEYAYYSQNDRLYNSALFGGIRFENPPVETSAFFYDTGIISIFKPGIYLATYIVNFPSESTFTTTLALQLNNQNVLGTVKVIAKTETGIPYTATAQAILPITSTGVVRLSSSSILNITSDEFNTAASISIIELLR